MGSHQFIEQYILESSRNLLSLGNHTEKIEEIIHCLGKVVQEGGGIFTCGNGGSACDAMHMVEELVARYLRERPGIRAQHLCDAGTITCWANDYSFEAVFERQVETLLKSYDSLLVFSTSGNSKNILRALQAAKKIGAKTIAFLGKGGGSARNLAEISLVVDSNVTSHIQEAHITLVHIICDRLETLLFGENAS